MHVDARCPRVRAPGDNLFATVLRRARRSRIGGPPRAGAGALRAHRSRSRDCCVMLGMSYLRWEGPWARVLALLAASLERWDEASAHFEEAIARCRRLGARPYLARTEYEYGRALIARGRDRARARELIASARAAAEELGMPGLVRLADAAAGRDRLARPSARRRRRRRAPAPRPAPRRGRRGAVLVRARGRVLGGHARGGDVPAEGQPGHPVSGPAARGAGTRDPRAGSGGRARGAAARASTRRSTPATRASCWTTRRGAATSAGWRTWKRRWPRPSRSAMRRAPPGPARRSRCWAPSWAGRSGWGAGPAGAGGAAERARSAVQRRIKNAIERIGEHDQALAALLGRTVRTGNYCVYRARPLSLTLSPLRGARGPASPVERGVPSDVTPPGQRRRPC